MMKMGEAPPMHTASWRIDYDDNSGPKLLVEVTRLGCIAITQHDSIVLNLNDAIWLYAALLPAIRVAERKPTK